MRGFQLGIVPQFNCVMCRSCLAGARSGALDQSFQQRLGRLISDFIERSEIPLPLYLIAIGANGTVVVSRHTESGNEAVCSSAGALTTPVTTAPAAQSVGDRSSITPQPIGANREADICPPLEIRPC